jgi:glycosyltransferase involved in cell wall biosynthesis
MIYVCVPSYNEAATVGLLLWKVRRVFGEFPREYQLLVVDDGSTDQSADVLAPYAKVLPLTVLRHPSREGYAASVEELLRLTVERTDRPRRDCAVLMHADFRHGPEFLPEMVKRIESGADLVVGQGTLQGEPSRAQRWLRRGAPWLLRGRVHVPGVSDVVSGFMAIRLVALRHALRAGGDHLLASDGWAANAELIAKAAQYSRRIDTINTIERHDLRQRPSRIQPWVAVREIWRARRGIRLAPRVPQATAETAS